MVLKEAKYDWVKYPTDLPRENLVLVTAKTTKTTYHPEDKEGYTVRIFNPIELHEAARSLAKRPVGLNHIHDPIDPTIGLIKGAFTVDANWNESEQEIEGLLFLPTPFIEKIRNGEISKVSVEYSWRDEVKTNEGVEFKGFVFDRIDLLYGKKAGDINTELRLVEGMERRGLMEGIIVELETPKAMESGETNIKQDQIQQSVDDPSLSFFKKAEESMKRLGEPFAGFKDWDACIAYAKKKGATNPEAYCGYIKARAEPKKEALPQVVGLTPSDQDMPSDVTVNPDNPKDLELLYRQGGTSKQVPEESLREEKFEPPEAGTLPSHGKKILANAYASCRKQYPEYSKERCSKIAWGAVKRIYKKVDDKWTLKEDSDPEWE